MKDFFLGRMGLAGGGSSISRSSADDRIAISLRSYGRPDCRRIQDQKHHGSRSVSLSIDCPISIIYYH